MQNVYVFGHFGGFNAGDEAMLGGLLSIIPDTTVVTVKYKNNVHINWGKNVFLYQGSFLSFAKQLKKNDTLILCGGTHFHDDYTFVRLLRHWLYLSRINYIFLLAKKKGATTLCIGNGFGPFNHFITKAITKLFGRLCDKVTVRDVASLVALKKIKTGVDLVHSDLASLLYLNNGDHIAKTKKNIVGISLTSLKSISDKTINDEQLVTNLAEALKNFTAKNKHVHYRLFVIRSGNRESDHDIISALEAELKNNDIKVDQHVFNNNLEELTEGMSECAIFIASRFHSAVLTSILGSKMIMLSYHKKLTDFAAEISLPNEYIFNLQEKNVLNRLQMIDKALEKLYHSKELNYHFNVEKIKYLKQELQSLL